MPANFKYIAVATGLEKVTSFQFQRGAMPENVQTTIQLHSFRKVMLKIFQARLQQYMNQEFSDVQGRLRLRKNREIRDQIANI